MLRLIDLEVYNLSLEIGKKVWDIVVSWDHFNRDTLGKQFINAADSMALNIAEGFGRFHYKENKNFNYFSRGSAFECTACLRKAYERGLITTQQNQELREYFALFLKKLNGYIKSIGKSGEHSTELKEDSLPYFSQTLDLENYLGLELENEDSPENK